MQAIQAIPMRVKLFKPKVAQPEQGFTLVEVLVAILIATIFVTVTMQMMVIAAIFKARAQEYAEATTWIQEDLEKVKYQAANFQYTSLADIATAGASSINVASASDFANNDKLKVGSDIGTYTISSISGTTSGTTLNITPNLGTNQSQGAAAVATTRCKNSILANKAASGASSINVASVGNFANNDKLKVGSDIGTYTISSISGMELNITPNLGSEQIAGAVVVLTDVDANKGFADGLRDKVTDRNETEITNFVTVSKNSTRTKKEYILTRTTTLSNEAPYNVLQVRYNISPTSGGSSIANFYTEVIPDAALQCPK
jgi:prepilin-type N-terminal cleavage/methylation domain-containing protein